MQFSRSLHNALTITFLLAFILIASRRVNAQDSNLVFGLGLQTVANTDDGFGLGLRGRLSIPVNADLSFAADLGFAGYFLSGRDETVYSSSPQVSAILTMPGESSAIYFLAGVGGYLSTGGDDSGHNGPLIHFGVGGVKPLTDGALFYEIDPAVIIKNSSLAVSVPIRVGFIF